MNGIGSSHTQDVYAQAKIKMNLLAPSIDEDCKIWHWSMKYNSRGLNSVFRLNRYVVLLRGMQHDDRWLSKCSSQPICGLRERQEGLT